MPSAKEQTQIKTMSYRRARQMLHRQAGIIALSRPDSIEGRLITQVTHARYSHATMLGWPAQDVWGFAETRQHVGARVMPFSDEVRAWPGYYDLFEVRDTETGGFYSAYDGELAWAFMVRAAGAQYSYRHLSRVWLRRRISRIIPALPNSDEPLYPRNCSALVHAAIRNAGGPTVKSYDSDVVPQDLADPRYFRYLLTIVWSEEEADHRLSLLASERLAELQQNRSPFSSRGAA